MASPFFVVVAFAACVLAMRQREFTEAVVDARNQTEHIRTSSFPSHPSVQEDEVVTDARTLIESSPSLPSVAEEDEDEKVEQQRKERAALVSSGMQKRVVEVVDARNQTEHVRTSSFPSLPSVREDEAVTDARKQIESSPPSVAEEDEEVDKAKERRAALVSSGKQKRATVDGTLKEKEMWKESGR
mmetsp:Transcript_107144/g.301567  ORF Transcript_107144/g.301567 Transcript_107144/m.301567 type:complete len:186 (+) Transcript_107144:114-671(+)|eukprot:CAMPEP_0117493170 /NCGR_PEP_ID=MMETSP0784-20121206/18961_1 /TAXON_ID=39447 /ORGANISM="" /LENGTH=185 /DNA_ID=CAMNT_0005288017 /DNA_START=114 /DNA_END=674 /DNA_ORIENTATION=+